MASLIYRLLAEDGSGYNDDGSGGEEHEHFGVHISYSDLYTATVFLATIYIAGLVTAKFLRMPALVGEIFAGIMLGPEVSNIVPNPEAFVLLGEIG